LKLSEIQTTLRDLNATPTKSLGQNFLHDRNLAEWIVSQTGIQPGDRWVEIGPGLGALTECALQRSPHGILIEKDDRLIDYLRERFPQLRVIHADAARYDTRELLAEGPLKVLGNLPYYVSSQILFNFTPPYLPAERQIFTLQKELAERLAAQPGSRDFGAPTALIGRQWKVRLLRNLPPTVFLPEPKVDSSVISLEPRDPDELPPCDPARFIDLVKKGFSQRRKQLGNLLAESVPDWNAMCASLGISTTSRAEALSLVQWCQLAAWSGGETGSPSSATAQDVHGEIFDVVDEHDAVTGSASRFEVHRQKLRHRAIHVFVMNSRDEIFLQRRSRWKDTHPLKWDSSAAGHVNSGDDYHATAGREIREELGVEAVPVFRAKIGACEETGEEFVHLYEAHHDGPFTLPPAEIDCGTWFPLQPLERWIELRPQDFAPGFLKCWQTWRRGRPEGLGRPA
jgi:16S rRNA (adenine1518-N6/adenine1519-N6)-dimethyltransferase